MRGVEGAWGWGGVAMMVNVRGGGLDGKVAATRHYDHASQDSWYVPVC